MIQIRNLSKSYILKGITKNILDNINLDVAEHSFTTIFGPNGCGKSTLVNIIAGLDTATSGSIQSTTDLRNNLGYVFQDYRRSLLPWKSVKENILFPLRLKRVSNVHCEKSLAEIIELTGISLDLKQNVFSLSGGQAQLVCILRALIVRPKLLILDEPFAALDYEKTIFLRELISSISKKLALTVLFISHDLDEAIYLGDQVIFLTNAPTKIDNIVKIDLPFPREQNLTTSKEFIIYKENALEYVKRAFSFN